MNRPRLYGKNHIQGKFVMSRFTLVIASLALAGIAAVACAAPPAAAEPIAEIVPASDVAWAHLNPARGDKSPSAGTLWGDRNGTGPTGFLLRPADGFESPPHIHNVSYRGVVISGLIHNDDPDAAEMWMPAGSFWTQPKGEAHITAAKGSEILAYIEIEEGPYLVMPADQAFDSGERPVNVDASNIVWVDQPGAAGDDGPRTAYLWGEPREGRLSGSLVKLPAGFSGEIRSRGSTFRAVVIGGRPEYHAAGGAGVTVLEQGGYFGSQGEAAHGISSGADRESIIYVRTDGGLEIHETAHRD